MGCSGMQNTAKARNIAGEILRKEGVAGFWRGNTLNLLRTAPYKVQLVKIVWKALHHVG